MLKANSKIIFIFGLITISQIYNAQTFRIKFTRMKCNVTDKSYVVAEICRIKAESRDVQYVTAYLNFLQLPINEFNIRFRFLKRANGYKPFLYDFTLNCNFIKHLNPVTKLVWGWIKDVSNLNHSCPLTEAFVVKRLENRYLQQQLSVLPLANGDYALFIDYASLNVTRIYGEIYGTLY